MAGPANLCHVMKDINRGLIRVYLMTLEEMRDDQDEVQTYSTNRSTPFEARAERTAFQRL